MKRLTTLTSALLLCISCDGMDELTPSSRTIQLAELDRAAEKALDCMRDSGLTQAEAEYDPHAFTFVFSVEGSGDEINRQVEECMGEYFEPINERWQEANATAIETENRAFENALLACLDDRGYAERPGGAAHVASVAAAPSVRKACLLDILRARQISPN